MGELRQEMRNDTEAGAEEAEAWGRCLERLLEELQPRDFNTWIKPLQPHHDTDHRRLVLLAPNPYVQARVKEVYLERIAQLISEYAPSTGLDITVGSRNNAGDAGGPRRVGPKQRVRDNAEGKGRQGLNPNYLFDNFVEGRSNAIAKATALHMAESFGCSSSRHNPVLLYGGVGLGKTHLMHAVGNAILAKSPSARTMYLRSESFVNEMVDAVKRGGMQQFGRQYRSMQVLLIDDIQFFAAKARSQQELCHLFDDMVERGDQMVLTCDRHPRTLENLEEALTSRFLGGLAVKVEPPDVDTRATILQKKGEIEGIDVPSGVALYIAKRICSNVRELEGALQRVFAHSKFTDSPVTIDLVRRALQDLFAAQGRLITIERIQRTVAKHYGIDVGAMISSSRARVVTRPRQMAMCLAKELTNRSLPEIGHLFGGRDHTTVMHACNRVKVLRGDDQDLDDAYENLKRLITK